MYFILVVCSERTSVVGRFDNLSGSLYSAFIFSTFTFISSQREKRGMQGVARGFKPFIIDHSVYSRTKYDQ